MGRPRKVGRQRYCEFLAATQINRTQTYFANHVDDFAHDAVQRYLKGDCLTAAEVWTQVRPHVKLSDKGYIIFDDSVMDKRHSRRMALVRRQWSGNEKRTIRGMGVVTCVYVNPETREFWIIDYRIYAPDDDGKSKVDHVLDMLRRLFEKEARQELRFRCVLMDTWYAVTTIMLRILRGGKYFCCPVKGNRTLYISD
ncbi:transposase, partial [Deinococcus marmoris]|uniref:transposase n=1 Tax=Deinococcus marmoris TaxID=249408 RepID=UPI0011152840